jgi:rubrerythrin
VGSQVLTASAVMRIAEALEDDAAAFYEALAGRFEAGRTVFEGFAKESRRNKTDLRRTYQETISDALEATFSFEGLAPASVDPGAAETPDFDEAVRRAVEIEEAAAAFYRRAAEKAQNLLATLPRAFTRVAVRRAGRLPVLASLGAAPASKEAE